MGKFLLQVVFILLSSILTLKSQVATHTTVTSLVSENLGSLVNSSSEELHPVISSDGNLLYFVRDGHPNNFATQDIWYSLKTTNGWSKAIHPNDPINKGTNAGVCNISPDGNQLIVRGAFVDGEYESAGLSVITKNKKGEWKEPKKIEIKNFTKYSDKGKTNNSFLAPNGKTLIFAFSDRDNGDRHDLYVSHLTLKEKWEKPKSVKDFTKFVSKAINNNTWSEPEKIVALSIKNENEFAPFMAADGITMYYSTDKAGGYGNQDIWMTKRLDDTWQNWSEPKNLGSTVNTNDWDSYYTLDAKGEEAYLTSSKNSYGGSDIVKIKLITELRPNPVVLIKGKVFNSKTKEPLSANIEYENLVDGKNAGIAVSNPLTGEYQIVLPYGVNYGLLAYSEKYISMSDNLDLSKTASYMEITKDLYLAPIEIGSTIRLNNIFFDNGLATLRKESFPEIDRLAGLMIQNKSMVIELSGHTDNVGSDVNNLKLSEDRAKSVLEYLVANGISADKITSKGYGETKPITTNDTEEGRQLNRRVEFTIIKN